MLLSLHLLYALTVWVPTCIDIIQSTGADIHTGILASKRACCVNEKVVSRWYLQGSTKIVIASPISLLRLYN